MGYPGLLIGSTRWGKGVDRMGWDLGKGCIVRDTMAPAVLHIFAGFMFLGMMTMQIYRG